MQWTRRRERGRRLVTGSRVEHALASGRRAYLHVARGEVRLEGESDGARIESLANLRLEALGGEEISLFDLA